MKVIQERDIKVGMYIVNLWMCGYDCDCYQWRIDHIVDHVSKGIVFTRVFSGTCICNPSSEEALRFADQLKVAVDDIQSKNPDAIVAILEEDYETLQAWISM